MSEGIAYNGRTLVVGPTGSGKSELLNTQLSAFRCQRLLYDSKWEFRIAGVRPATSVEQIDWALPVIHFRPGEDARADAQELFAAAFRRPGPLVICAHELGDLCDYNANAAPHAVRRYLVQGRALGKGLLAGTQRPVGVPKAALTEAGDLFLFASPPLSWADLETVGRELGMRPEDLSRTLIDVERHGEHSFVHWSRRGRQITEFPPLPAHIRGRSIVQRTHDH